MTVGVPGQGIGFLNDGTMVVVEEGDSLIGKEVSVESSTVVVSDGTPGPIDFELSEAADEVVVTIYNAAGEEVYREELGSLGDGSHAFEWDCMTTAGAQVPDGQYIFRIDAADSEGTTLPVSTVSTFVVEGVKFEGGVTYLMVNGSLITLNEVISVRTASAPDDPPQE